ncbi:hypothetical protein D3C78_865660 [compost metagenome]
MMSGRPSLTPAARFVFSFCSKSVFAISTTSSSKPGFSFAYSSSAIFRAAPLKDGSHAQATTFFVAVEPADSLAAPFSVDSDDFEDPQAANNEAVIETNSNTDSNFFNLYNPFCQSICKRFMYSIFILEKIKKEV